MPQLAKEKGKLGHYQRARIAQRKMLEAIERGDIPPFGRDRRA